LAIEMLYMSKQKANQMAITVLLHLVGRRYNQAIDALITDDLLY